MALFDILLDASGELQVSNLDIMTGDPVNNYIAYIVNAFPGHYKEAPQLGVGIDMYLNRAVTGPAEIERAIRVQLESDVFKRPNIDVSKYPTISIDKVEFSL